MDIKRTLKNAAKGTLKGVAKWSLKGMVGCAELLARGSIRGVNALSKNEFVHKMAVGGAVITAGVMVPSVRSWIIRCYSCQVFL